MKVNCGGLFRGTRLCIGILVFVCVPCIAQQNNAAPNGTFASDARESQPLGTLAHQQQEQKSSNSSKHRVITDEDMPSHPAQAPATDVKVRAAQPKNPKPEPINESIKPKSEGEDLLAGIKDQKEKIVELQSDLKLQEEKMESWKGDDCRKYYAENRDAYDACPEVTRLAAEHDRTKRNLEHEQASLADLQEKARKAGYTSRDYDPD
jgi:hypothetical protein